MTFKVCGKVSRRCGFDKSMSNRFVTDFFIMFDKTDHPLSIEFLLILFVIVLGHMWQRVCPILCPCLQKIK